MKLSVEAISRNANNKARKKMFESTKVIDTSNERD